MAAKSSKVLRSAGASPVQQSSLQALLPPVPAPVPALTAKDLKDALGKHLQQMAEVIDEKLDDKLPEKLSEILEEKLEEKFADMKADMRADILSAFQGMALCIENLDERMEDLSQNNSKLEAKVLETGNVVDKIDNDLTLVQYHQMEFAIRIRGLKENPKEDLKQVVSEALEGILGQSADEIVENIDKIFRVNSWIARQRKLPRDVVVYFTKRSIRNEVIQVSYDTKLVVAEQEVLVLKEIPPRVLRRRKDFAFLAQELKKRDIKFRWEIPVGMVVMHEGTRHRLVTVMQAQDFYNNVLKATPLPLLESTKKNGEGKPQNTEGATQAEETATGGDQITASSEDARDQRMTRAAFRRARREQEQDQQKVMESSKRTYSEAVGGARPKEVKELLTGVLQKLQDAKHGD